MVIREIPIKNHETLVHTFKLRKLKYPALQVLGGDVDLLEQLYTLGG